MDDRVVDKGVEELRAVVERRDVIVMHAHAGAVSLRVSILWHADVQEQESRDSVLALVEVLVVTKRQTKNLSVF